MTTSSPPYKKQITDLPALFLILLLSSLYLCGVSAVPFHPDESTQIFMSADVEIASQNLAALFWKPNSQSDARQQYRLLDAPLTRYLIGIGRQIARLAPLPADWDWSKSWDENRADGALPSENLLTVSRISIACLFPVTLAALYIAIKSAFNRITACLFILLIGTHALILLHTRRAMAEGTLLFAIALTWLAMTRAIQRPYLLALPAALAFCAKQSAVIYAIVGMLTVVLPAAIEKAQNWQKSIGQILLYLLLYLALVFALNPFLWRNPLQASRAAWQARQNLLQRQTQAIGALAPSQILDTPAKKAASLLLNLYFNPPSFAEVENYRQQTRLSEQTYSANPFHRLGRGQTAGTLMLILSLTGFGFACLAAARAPQQTKRQIVLLVAACLLQTAWLLALIPFPFQRYYLPLLPFVCLWAAYALERLIRLVIIPDKPQSSHQQPAPPQNTVTQG
ncbi:MAG: hypothetical protein HPY45_06680 [Anaerolineae bacterium]|nr:hypothetical protein [Anaerolineae bacterium]